MESFEKRVGEKGVEGTRIEQLRDFYFREIVYSRIINEFINSFEDVGFESKDIERIVSIVSDMSEEDAKHILALPYELRRRVFEKYLSRIEQGEITPEEMVRDLLDKNKKYGFTLGYHFSEKRIPRVFTRDGEQWTVRGTEVDDRDNAPGEEIHTLRMAYYSEDYLNRYKKKAGNYLYVVRAETGNTSSHKMDQKNHWGRAPSLSIITELDVSVVEREIDASMQKENSPA